MTTGDPCSVCPLRGRPQIRGEGPERDGRRSRPKRLLAFLGEAPGRSEVKKGRPFCGPAGGLLQILLQQAGVKRENCIVTNALLCPIQDKESLGRATIAEAIRCCNRRREIEGDLKKADFIVALGGYAGQALTGEPTIQKIRGTIQQSAWGPCLTTYHPSYLLKGKRGVTINKAPDVLTQVVIDDIRNAKRYMKGDRGPDIRMTIGPSPDAVRGAVNYITQVSKVYALDVEADSLDMMTADLNVVGIAYPREEDDEEYIRVLVIPWWEGNYTEDEFRRIRRALVRLARNPAVTMVAHNAQYDTTLWERNICTFDQPIRDTLIEHKAVWPELYHDLQGVVAQFFPVPPWKYEFRKREKEREKLLKKLEQAERRFEAARTEKTQQKTRDTLRKAKAAWESAWAREPRDLCVYNGYDVGYTMALHPELVQEMKAAKVVRVSVTDSRLGEITRRMTLDGIPLLVDEQAKLSRTLKKRLRAAERALQKLVRLPPKSRDPDVRAARRELLEIGPGDFNPNSQRHKIALLDTYDVPVDAMTATGMRSCRREHLIAYQEENPAVDALLEYTDAKKVLSTFVGGKGIKLGADGRLHPSWNAHAGTTKDTEDYGAVSGRWTSSPNMQNWPKSVRSLLGFPESDPRVIISADYSQIELRILALLAGEERLIEAFLDPKRDPHAENAAALFEDEFTKLEPHSKEWTELRRLTKTATYAWMYGAGVNTMYGAIRKWFPNIDLQQVEYLRERFNDMCPAILDYREDLMEEVSRTGELRTLILNRRRVFPLAQIVEPDASVVWNYPIQATAADIIGIRVLKLYPYLPSDTILISQIHDAILLEAMADKVDSVTGLLEKYLPTTIRYGGHAMVFPIEVTVGKTWADT